MQFSSFVMLGSSKVTSVATFCILNKVGVFTVLITDFVCKHLTSTNDFIFPVGSEVFPSLHKGMRYSTGIMEIVQCHTVTEYRSPDLLCSIYSQVNPSQTALPSCTIFSASFPTSIEVRKNLIHRTKFAKPPSAH